MFGSRIKFAVAISAVAGSLFSVPAALVAQTAEISSTGQSERSLGRLFLTPEERFQLDEARRSYEYGVAPEPATKVEEATNAGEQPPAFSQFTINGLVIRSSGTSSTWVNGSRLSQGEVTREGVKVDAMPDGQAVKITLPSGVDSIQLKAGQKIDVASGAVLDAYEVRQGEDSRNAFAPAEPDSTDLLEQASDVSERAVEATKDVVEEATERLKRLLGDG